MVFWYYIVYVKAVRYCSLVLYTSIICILPRHCKISKVASFELISELINFEILSFRLRIGFLINYFRNFRISNFELDSELINFEIFRLRIVPIFPLIRCLRKNNPSNRPHRLGGLSARSAEPKFSIFAENSGFFDDFRNN